MAVKKAAAQAVIGRLERDKRSVEDELTLNARAISKLTESQKRLKKERCVLQELIRGLVPPPS